MFVFTVSIVIMNKFFIWIMSVFKPQDSKKEFGEEEDADKAGTG